MPFTAVDEASRTEYFLPQDYSYSWRSKNTLAEFKQFVKKIRMEAFRVSGTRYQQKEKEDVKVIPDADGWISYYEGRDFGFAP